MRPSTTSPVVRALRPEPHRGDQVAAGVVVLATLTLLVQVRFGEAWGDGARFVVAALAAGFVGALASLSPLESDRPRSYQSVLYVTACLLALLALAPLAAWLGAASVTSPGALTWVMLLVGLLALTFSLSRNSSYCTLVAALAFMLCLQGAVQWIFDPSGASTARWVFFLVLLADLLGAVMLRDRRRRHAVMLADAAGIAVLGLAVTFVPAVAVGLIDFGPVPTGGELSTTTYAFRDAMPWGWALVGFAAGFGLIAYAGADREPGPGYLGVALLVAFAWLTGTLSEATLLGWPLVLALGAGAFLVLGLRPSHPLPPEPVEDVGEEPRTEPLPTPPERRPGALWQRFMPAEKAEPPEAETAVAPPAPKAPVGSVGPPVVAAPARPEPPAPGGEAVPPATEAAKWLAPVPGPSPVAPPTADRPPVAPDPDAEAERAPEPAGPEPITAPVAGADDPTKPHAVIQTTPDPPTQAVPEVDEAVGEAGAGAGPGLTAEVGPAGDAAPEAASEEPASEAGPEPESRAGAGPEVQAEADPEDPPAAEPTTEPHFRPLPPPRPGRAPRLAPHPDAEDDTTRAYPTIEDDDEL